MNVGVLNKFMTTSQVVKYLNNKKYHRHKLYNDELKLKLGAKRIGKGKNLVFETEKVISFKYLNLHNNLA